MEETKKKGLISPPNYITLQHLKELRMKEQAERQQKLQTEKEEEEEEQKIVKEEQQLRDKEKQEKKQKEEEEEEERLRIQIIKTNRIIRIGNSFGHPYRKNFQNISQKCYVRKEKNEDYSVLQKQGIDETNGVEIPYQDDQNLKEQKKKKWGKKKNKKIEVKESSLTETLDKFPPLGNNSEEIISVVPSESKRNTPNGFMKRGKKSQAAEVLMNPTLDIEQNIGILLLVMIRRNQWVINMVKFRRAISMEDLLQV